MTQARSCCAKTDVSNIFPKQEKKSGLPSSSPLQILSLHNASVHPSRLPMAFPPFSSCIKEGLPGVWPQNQESLTKEVFTHELRACLPTAPQFARVGYDHTLKTGKSGYFSHRFSGKSVREGRIGRNSSGFWVQNLINAPQTPMFTEGNVRLRIKCWVASHVSVNGHAISTEGIIEKWGSSRGFPLKK